MIERQVYPQTVLPLPVQAVLDVQWAAYAPYETECWNELYVSDPFTACILGAFMPPRTLR